MRNRARILAAVAFITVGLVAFGFGVAQAQTGGPGPGEPPVTGSLTGTVNLTPDEISKRAEGALARMEMNMMGVQRMIDKADQEGNTVKLDCLNDKLNIIDTRLRSARDRKPLLDAALSAKDTGQATTFLQVIQNHQDESNKARAQAESCVGTEIGIMGDTKTTTTIDPNVPTEPSQPPVILTPPTVGLELPPPGETTPDL